MNNNNCAPFLNKDYLTEDICFQTRLRTKPFEIKKIESEEPATEKTLVIIGEGKHTFPSRTRSLSSQSPMVVRPRCRARVGSCQYYEARSLFWWSGFSCFWGLRLPFAMVNYPPSYLIFDILFPISLVLITPSFARFAGGLLRGGEMETVSCRGFYATLLPTITLPLGTLPIIFSKTTRLLVAVCCFAGFSSS